MVGKFLRGLAMVGVSASVVLLGGFTSAASAASYDVTPEATTWIPNGTVYAMAEVNGVVYIGGSFTRLRNPVGGAKVTRNRLAALDATTGALLPWDPSADNTVRALAVGPDGTIYAGGDFLNVDGSSQTRIAAITPDGATVPGFSASASSTVRKISASDAGLFVAGNFSTINGASQSSVAKLDASTGATVTGWNANVTGGKVRAMTLAPDGVNLIIGGLFTALSHQPRPHLGEVSLDTGAVAAWSPTAAADPTAQVLDMTTDNGVLYAGMGGSGGRAIAWSLADGTVLWQRHGDGDVQSVAYSDGVVYVGGHFGPSFGGQVRDQLAALDPADGTVEAYALSMTGSDHPGIWAIVIDDSYLRIGGGFFLANAPQAKYAALPLLPPA